MSDRIEETQQHESCECGHHHGHHHGGNQVLMASADGHLLGTMTAYTPASLAVAEMNMELSMKDVVIFIKENGGTPLQVKASLKDMASTVLLNLSGTEIFHSESAESTETDPTKVKCKLLVVADGLDSDLLKNSLETYMDYFVNNSF